METIETLKQVGFSANEAKIYLALLQMGESTVQPISQKAGLTRPYCYNLLDELVEKGFASYAERRGRRRYCATQPKVVRKILLDKVKEIDPILPELEGLYQMTPSRPRARYFEGKEGIRAIYEEMTQETNDLVIFGSGEDWSRSFADWYEFMQATAKKVIGIRDLSKRTPESEKWAKLYKKPTQELRYIKDEWNFPSDQFVWGNKVAMLCHGTEMHGIVIESKEISTSMKTVFEMFWKMADKI